MSDNKKYYYLKLKENFFDTDEMLILESMPDGVLYSNILLKLYLRSLKNEGKLMFNDKIPYNPQMISTITRHPVGVIEKALKLFSKLNLIDLLDNGSIYMTDIQNFIGKSSSEGDRKREYRKKIQEEKKLLSPKRQMSDKHPPEIELEKDIDKEKDNIDQCELLWKQYPLKKGKKRAFNKIPRLIKKYSYEQMERCVKRYVEYIEHRRKTDFPQLKYKQGDGFFSATYEDYLDENYEVIQEDVDIKAESMWSGIES